MSPSPAPPILDLLARIRALSDRSLQALRRASFLPAAAPLDLRIAGRVLLHSGLVGLVFRPWVLALLPAAGALASGLLTWRLAPEAAGGGGGAGDRELRHALQASAAGAAESCRRAGRATAELSGLPAGWRRVEAISRRS